MIVSAAELFNIASDVSNIKIQSLIKEYYDKIIAAAYEGKFSVTIHLEGNEFDSLTVEVMVALESINQLFPGIQTTTDMRFLTQTFAWSQPDPMIQDA
jgi:hypothetical protein